MARKAPHILAAVLICLLGSGGLLWMHHLAVDMQLVAMAADGDHVHHHSQHACHHHHAPASPDGSDEDAPGHGSHPDCPECALLTTAKWAAVWSPTAFTVDELSEERLVVFSFTLTGVQFRELPPARGPPLA